MKCLKGMMIGTVISTVSIMLYYETMNMDKKKLLKKGKRFVRNMKKMSF